MNPSPTSKSPAAHQLRIALWAVRLLCAAGWTVGGFSFALPEGSYMAFAPFFWEWNNASVAAHERPGDADLQLRASLARHYYQLSIRGKEVADTNAAFAAFGLCGAAVVGMFVGTRIKAALREMGAA